MLTNLVNMFSSAMTTKNISTAKTNIASQSSNPFASPFLGSKTSKYDFYGKNNPVKGGYFAGYHNGMPNIVGRKLFIEV